MLDWVFLTMCALGLIGLWAVNKTGLEEASRCGYLRQDNDGVWQQDLPSLSPAKHYTGIPRIALMYKGIEYYLFGKDALEKDESYKRKYVYGKTQEEANQAYPLTRKLEP